MTHQSSLLPNTDDKPKRLRKATLRSVVVELPVRKLTAAEEAQRDANLAAFRNARARAKVGDIRTCDRPCKCGEERLEEIVEIKPQGGIVWEVRCLSCQPD